MMAPGAKGSSADVCLWCLLYPREWNALVLRFGVDSSNFARLFCKGVKTCWAAKNSGGVAIGSGG